MRKYTSEDFIRQASGEYLTEPVDSLGEVTEDMLWEGVQDWDVVEVCRAIKGTAMLIADCVNKALEDELQNIK